MRDRESRTRVDGTESSEPEERPTDPELERLVEQLEELEEYVDNPDERKKVRKAIHAAHRVPGAYTVENGIKRYTTRDMAEAFVGSVLLSLPLLVEDGVFEIAEYLAGATVSEVPIFLISNVLFVGLLTTALIYWTDIRDVGVADPIFGFVPRRLIGILGVSLVTVTGLMIMWGRIFEGEPTTAEAVGRITVIWTAGAFGAALGDILPEANATDPIDRIDDREG
ncbi:DUF2391 domain-containing protein [Natronococcus roseus]|uniref:DUF2391 domain-containing protein n=1 Tax=Natronococcus roseus TaxID=1052014 RepID=UPI00374DBC3F